MTKSPLSPDETRVLQQGAALKKPLARAAAIGRANGLGYVVFGALTTVMAAPGLDWIHLAEGALVTVVGVLQRREAPKLERGSPQAASDMSRNEFWLMIGLAIYCLARLFVLTPETTALSLDPRLARASGGDLDGLVDAVHGILFGSLLLVTLLYQGGMALYFRRRIPAAERYQRETPDWARATLGSL
ncbi:hypothetical protein Poly30_34610 [Planctomycetes bacterium Poly30]|uniref:Uncharacterized protein n=1 Tax=Saltatorellus ferox TaxID=2528018 RepID=A0A518EV00_9BACT|nr:hypothetical protein Poly30_34610 [Planctomycetes bacterium Poly30]